MLKRLLVLAVLLLGATGARAAVLLSLDGLPTPNGSGGFTYKYDARLQGGAVMDPGNFFTLFDFAGYSGLGSTSFVVDHGINGITPAGGTFNFDITTAPLGVVPPGTLIQPTDSASLQNVTVTLAPGSDNIVPPGTTIKLGTLILDSSINSVSNRISVGSQFLVDNVSTANISSTLGPVPEPSTYGFMVLGLLAAGLSYRRARHR